MRSSGDVYLGMERSLEGAQTLIVDFMEMGSFEEIVIRGFLIPVDDACCKSKAGVLLRARVAVVPKLDVRDN